MDAMKRMYPPANFPTLWARMGVLAADGRLLISEEVKHETAIHDDELKEWVEAVANLTVVLTDDVVAAEVTHVLRGNERLVMNMRGRNRADPFVIAVARLRGATVVTGEGADGTAARPKIPYVCTQLGVPCVRVLDVIQQEGWVI